MMRAQMVLDKLFTVDTLKKLAYETRCLVVMSQIDNIKNQPEKISQKFYSDCKRCEKKQKDILTIWDNLNKYICLRTSKNQMQRFYIWDVLQLDEKKFFQASQIDEAGNVSEADIFQMLDNNQVEVIKNEASYDQLWDAFENKEY